jgi:hypothetical protein
MSIIHHSQVSRIPKDRIDGLEPVPHVYNGGSRVEHPVIWTGEAKTNSSGMASFYPTSDGTSSGTSVFQRIFAASPVGVADVSRAVDALLATVISIQDDLKRIDVMLVKGGAFILGGVSVSAAPTGSKVLLTIFGE